MRFFDFLLFKSGVLKNNQTKFSFFAIFLKNPLTNLDKRAIIVNCIIIAYYVHFWKNRGLLRYIYIYAYAEESGYGGSEFHVAQIVEYYFEWSD